MKDNANASNNALQSGSKPCPYLDLYPEVAVKLEEILFRDFNFHFDLILLWILRARRN